MKNSFLFLAFTLLSLNLFAQTPSDKKALEEIVQDMASAWSEGNGEGFAQHFAEEHDFFVWNGLYTKNMTKEQNSYGHQMLFDTEYKDTKHYAVVDQIRFVTKDVAVIMAMSAVVAKNAPKPEHPQVLWSATVLKKNGKWKIVSFHNADIEILDNAVSRANSPIPIKTMYKSWYDVQMKE